MFSTSVHSGQQSERVAGATAALVPASDQKPQERATSDQKSADQKNPQSQAGAPDSQKPSQSRPVSQTEKSATILESAIVLKVTTRLVVLDVVATDSHGHAVTDLNADDFNVAEDGKTQKIRVFSLRRPIPPDPNFHPRVLPPNVYSNIPTFPRTRTLNVILLDALNTTLPDQLRVRQKMLRYLESMPTDVPTAVYTLGQKLRMVQDFTTDPKLLQDAIKSVGLRASPALDNPAGGAPPDLLPPGVFEGLDTLEQEALQSFEIEGTSAQLDIRVHYTMEALQWIAHSLAGYRGRKNLVWVSSSFPLSVDPDATVSSSFTEFEGTRNYGEEIARTAQALTDSQIAVYPVDVRGVTVSSSFTAADTGRDRYGRSLSMGGASLANAMTQESTSIADAHASMELLASRTGGKAYYNRNDMDVAIRDGLDDGSTYYMLGYYPENKEWNGKFRKLQVKVARSGVKLRHRLGYYASDPAYVAKDQKQREQELGDVLHLDRPISTALFFQAGVIPPSEQTHNKVVVNYAIDAQALKIEHGDDGLEHADVECAVEAYTETGKVVNVASNAVQAAMKPENYKGVLRSGFPCMNQIELPAGNYLLRLAVRDDRTGLMGSVNAKVNIPGSVDIKRSQ